jgi:ADP-ribose pyrophosphatase YjhB (NUDIX family)
MRRSLPQPAPAALACGILEDGGRALFLSRKNAQGAETAELPCVFLQKGENPVAALASEFRRQAGIDGQVHEVLFESRHNAGSKRRKAWVPVLAFRVTAKNTAARPAPEFSGFSWIARNDLGKHRLARICAWLR